MADNLEIFDSLAKYLGFQRVERMPDQDPLKLADDVLDAKAKVTPGPWSVGKNRTNAIYGDAPDEFYPSKKRCVANVPHHEGDMGPRTEQDRLNAAYLVLAANAAPVLADEVKRLKTSLLASEMANARLIGCEPDNCRLDGGPEHAEAFAQTRKDGES